MNTNRTATPEVPTMTVARIPADTPFPPNPCREHVREAFYALPFPEAACRATLSPYALALVLDAMARDGVDSAIGVLTDTECMILARCV
jgi:hypothetical protein